MESGIGSFHHIGYLVKNIDKAMDAFQTLGFQLQREVTDDYDRDAKLCFMNGNGTTVELIEPRPESDLYSLLKKYSNMPYHICYTVNDIQYSIEKLKASGYLMFKEPQRAIAISPNAQVAFLFHRQIGIIELVQEGKTV